MNQFILKYLGNENREVLVKPTEQWSFLEFTLVILTEFWFNYVVTHARVT